MKYRKFQLLMSKYGFSLSIMLLELCLVFGFFLYLGRMAPILWVIVLIFMSMATIVAIVNRSMAPDSKSDVVSGDFCSCHWSLALSDVW